MNSELDEGVADATEGLDGVNTEGAGEDEGGMFLMLGGFPFGVTGFALPFGVRNTCRVP